MDLSVDIPPRDTTPGNGNETLRDLSGFPVVMVTGTSQVQVSSRSKDCCFNCIQLNFVMCMTYFRLRH